MGDSHCLPLAWRTIKLPHGFTTANSSGNNKSSSSTMITSSIMKEAQATIPDTTVVDDIMAPHLLTPILISGIKAYHLHSRFSTVNPDCHSRKVQVSIQSSLRCHLQSLKRQNVKRFILSVGEIDCRPDERGILFQVKKQMQDLKMKSTTREEGEEQEEEEWEQKKEETFLINNVRTTVRTFLNGLQRLCDETGYTGVVYLLPIPQTASQRNPLQNIAIYLFNSTIVSETQKTQLSTASSPRNSLYPYKSIRSLDYANHLMIQTINGKSKVNPRLLKFGAGIQNPRYRLDGQHLSALCLPLLEETLQKAFSIL
eukprot:g2295.t1